MAEHRLPKQNSAKSTATNRLLYYRPSSDPSLSSFPHTLCRPPPATTIVAHTKHNHRLKRLHARLQLAQRCNPGRRNALTTFSLNLTPTLTTSSYESFLASQCQLFCDDHPADASSARPRRRHGPSASSIPDRVKLVGRGCGKGGRKSGRH